MKQEGRSAFYEYFSNHNSIEQVHTFDELNDVDTDGKKVILINHMQDTIPDNFDEDKYGVITVNEIQYELRSLITLDCSTKWDGTVYARHGGYHKSWWVSH